MGQKKDITIEEKVTIRTLMHSGASTAEITAHLGRAVSAVRKQIAILKTLPPSLSPSVLRTRKGRIPKIAMYMKDRMRRYVNAHPFKTAKQLKNEVFGWSNVSV
jgi:hypothetical protein